MHFEYTVFGPLDEFHGFIQICYYECPHISGIYLESLLSNLQSPNIFYLIFILTLLCQSKRLINYTTFCYIS